MPSAGANNRARSCLQTMFTQAQKQRYLLQSLSMFFTWWAYISAWVSLRIYIILVGDGGTLDNSQSIMSDGCKHSSQYSVGLQPVSILAVLLDKWFVLHS